MNKKRIDKYLPKAIDLLEKSGVADEKGSIPKTFRGYISSFGAAVVMGSLRSAVAFNSVQNNADKERQKLMQIIYCIINDTEYSDDISLLQYIIDRNNDDAIKEQVYDAAIAVKLAMNAYDLIRG